MKLDITNPASAGDTLLHWQGYLLACGLQTGHGAYEGMREDLQKPAMDLH